MKTDKKQLLTIAIGTLVMTTLGYYFLAQRDLLATRVEAVGSLLFTFNGVAPEAPVFDEPDVKPGDCYVRTVEVTNEGSVGHDLAVRAEDILDPGLLSPIFSILISEEAATLYENTVGQFLDDGENFPNGVALSNLPAGDSTTYTFEVCMPPEAGNEYQDKTLEFDLVFGTYTEIPVPDECRKLAGQIQHVFYAASTGGFLHGSVENDLIYGSPVDDHLDASGGNDCIIDLGGNNHLEGEDGNDIIVSGDGDDLLEPGSGNDMVFAGGGNDEIELGTGNDVLDAGAGNDVVDAGSGNDMIRLGPGDDFAEGKSGEDIIYGEAGNDTIRGGSNNDELYGGENDDTIEGNSGDDYINGGPGIDSVEGNSGVDTCEEAEAIVSCEG